MPTSTPSAALQAWRGRQASGQVRTSCTCTCVTMAGLTYVAARRVESWSHSGEVLPPWLDALFSWGTLGFPCSAVTRLCWGVLTRWREGTARPQLMGESSLTAKYPTCSSGTPPPLPGGASTWYAVEGKPSHGSDGGVQQCLPSLPGRAADGWRRGMEEPLRTMPGLHTCVTLHRWPIATTMAGVRQMTT